jgi:hypothetical protein
MADIIKPGAGIIFMKVGNHAREPLSDIVVRKRKEIEDAGYALWGYGGNTCHPLTTVQPFAHAYERRGRVIYLCMEPMESHHFAVPERAEEYSVDGVTWEAVPESINVRGSRYALKIDGLEVEEFDLPLWRTRVASGHSVGLPGSQYIYGRVDKACLGVVDEADVTATGEHRVVHIGLVARLLEPYAVFVRNLVR